MTRASIIVLALVAVGCMPRQEASTQRSAFAAERKRYGAELYAAEAQLRTHRWAATCAREGAKNCGLVFDDIAPAAFARRFVLKVCEEHVETLDASSDDCRDRFRKLFLARLAERYHAVSGQHMRTHCDANPERCKDPRDVELWMLEQHNALITADYEARTRAAHDEHHSRANAARRQDAAQRRERARQVARTMHAVFDIVDFAVLGPPDTTCVSTDVAPGASATQCRERN